MLGVSAGRQKPRAAVPLRGGRWAPGGALRLEEEAAVDVTDNETIGTALGVHEIAAWQRGQPARVWILVHDRYRPMGACARCRYLLEHRQWSSEQDEGGIVPLDTAWFVDSRSARMHLLYAPHVPPVGT